MGTTNGYNCKHVYTFFSISNLHMRFALFETGSLYLTLSVLELTA